MICLPALRALFLGHMPQVILSLSSQPQPEPTTPYGYTMSHSPLPTTSSSNFESIFKISFKAYKKRTGKDITSHPL
ncbi:hypothetical protein H4582DRAFT_1997992, partial [Lactarius indigo]